MAFVNFGRVSRRALFAGTAIVSLPFLLADEANAQAYNWGGTGSTTTTTDYNLGTNWSNPPAGAPPLNSGTAAVFGSTGNGTVTITAGPITPDSWTFNAGAYSVSGQSVNFNGAGTKILNSGGANSISNDMTGAGIEVTGGSLTVSGTSSFTTTSVSAGATFINSGSLTSSVSNTGTGTNSGTITGTLSNTAGTFSNTGTVTGAASVSGGAVTNTGVFNSTVAVSGGSFTNNIGGQVQGRTTITGGTVTNVNGTFTGVTNTSGTYTQSAGVTSGGTTNTGTINANGGAFNGTTTNGAGGVFNVGGTVTSDNIFNNATATSRLLVNSGDFTVSGLFNDGTNAAGGVLVAAGATLNAAGGLSNGAVLINNGTVNGRILNGGTVSNSGTQTGGLINSAGTFTNTVTGSVSGASQIAAGVVTNNGIFTSTLSVSGGTFTNNAGAQVQDRTTITGGTVTNAGGAFAGVTNSSGTYTQSAGATNSGTTNSGTINANGGAFNGAVVNTSGSFNVGGVVTSNSTFANSAATSRLLINSGSYTATGTITNSGSNATGGIAVASGAILNATGGLTNNAGGTIVANGTITGALTMNGGTLGGNGTVGTTTFNGGTLSPGNSIGLLTVQGNLVMTSASSYMVEVSPSNADRVNVTGTATLGGATVNANFAPGSYVQKQYTILNATGVNGTFGSLVNTNLPTNFLSSLAYDASNVYLNLILSFNSQSGFTQNQKNVSNALAGFFDRTGGIPLVFGGLSRTALTQVSGETATGSQQATFDVMNQFMGVMTDPYSAGRGDVAGQGMSSFAAADEALAYAADGRKRSKAERDAFAMFTKAPPRVYEARWNVWAAGFGGARTTDGNATLGSNRTTSNIAGAAVGADYWFSPATVAGFSLAGGGTSFSVANGGSGTSDLFQAGAFIRHSVGSAYITAAAAYGWQEIRTDRVVTAAGTDLLRANFKANAYSGRIEGGNRWLVPSFGGVGVTPYAAVQVTALDLPTYSETVANGAGNFALTYTGKTVTNTRTELGLRTDKSFAVNDAILTLRGRAAWAHDFNTDRSLSATFQTLPGASFVVNGATAAANAALTSASAEMKWSNGWSTAATFEGEFSDVTRSYAGKGVVRYAW